MIYVTVTLCGLILALLAIRYDMYDREPWYMLLVATGLGAISCWAVGHLEDWVLYRWTSSGDQVLTQSTVAAFFEEASKFLVVVTIAATCRHHFNDPMDGIIYGAFAGLGFGICESMFYIDLAKASSPVPTHLQLFGQEAIRLILHFLTGGLGGFGFGLAQHGIRQWKIILPTWTAAAIGIHFLWDWSCGLPFEGSLSNVFQRSSAVSLMLFATFLFGVAVFTGVKWSRVVHPPKLACAPLLGWPFSLLARGNVDSSERKSQRQ